MIGNEKTNLFRPSHYMAGGVRLAERMRKNNQPMINSSNPLFRGRGAMRRKKPRMSGNRAVNKNRRRMPTANFS